MIIIVLKSVGQNNYISKLQQTNQEHILVTANQNKKIDSIFIESSKNKSQKTTIMLNLTDSVVLRLTFLLAVLIWIYFD